MNDIVINRNQQRDLHNARCYFQSFADKYADILGKRVITDFYHAFECFKQAHDPIREEENQRMDRRYKHYEAMRSYFSYHSVWSIYEVERLDNSLPSNYLDITHVKYYNQLVKVEKREGAVGLDWLALWAAAEKAILLSNDTHHIFIEGFSQSKEDPVGVYNLTTGS